MAVCASRVHSDVDRLSVVQIKGTVDAASERHIFNGGGFVRSIGLRDNGRSAK